MNDENQHQNQNDGWSFNKQSSEERKRKKKQEEPSFSLDVEIPETLRRNGLMYGLMSVTVVAFFAAILFLPGESATPKYDVPGGPVQKLTEQDISNWIEVTGTIQQKIENKECPPVKSRTLFAYYGELGERKNLSKRIQSLLKQKNLTLEHYRKITQDIALTYPFRDMYNAANSVSGSTADETSDENLTHRERIIRTNKKRIENSITTLENTWFNLLDTSKEIQQERKKEQTSTSSGENNQN